MRGVNTFVRLQDYEKFKSHKNDRIVSKSYTYFLHLNNDRFPLSLSVAQQGFYCEGFLFRFLFLGKC